jgi:chromosome segregation ATPase
MGKPLTQEPQENHDVSEIGELKSLVSQIGRNVDSLTNTVTSLSEDVKKPRVPQSVELELLQLKENISNIEDFSLETRFTAVIGSSSLGFVMTQYQRTLVDIFAARQSLSDLEAQIIDEHSSNEELLRERSRLTETTKQINKYMEVTLQNYRAISENNVALTGQVREQKLQLDAKQLVISNVEQLLSTIRSIPEGKDAPADVIAAIKSIVAELPKNIESTELPIPPGAEPQNSDEPPSGDDST